MKPKTLKRLIKVFKSKEDDLSIRLRSINEQLAQLSETIILWNEQIDRIEAQFVSTLQNGGESSKLLHLLKQKNILSTLLSSLSLQMEDLNRDFDELAEELKREHNKNRMLESKLNQEQQNEALAEERILEIELLERWQKN
jgi:hypothetical protein